MSPNAIAIGYRSLVHTRSSSAVYPHAGVTAGIIIEVVNAVLQKSMSDSTANFAAVELCAALSVYASLPTDAAEDAKTAVEDTVGANAESEGKKSK